MIQLQLSKNDIAILRHAVNEQIKLLNDNVAFYKHQQDRARELNGSHAPVDIDIFQQKIDNGLQRIGANKAMVGRLDELDDD